jgi:GWxTD domain-containing protein
MRDVPEMIRATRYIATRDEYRTMREARNPKAALDNFWLQFVGRPEQARELIRTYYGRIHDANVFFSGLKEGWSTDRGMVYVVFGHPDRTRRDRFGETWIYGEEGDVNALIFRFSNRASGDDFNTYELERYPGFRSPWEAMVSSWRRGKIRRR